MQFFLTLFKRGGGGGASCFRIGGAEDNFIFYIDEIKVKVQYFKAISIHFMSKVKRGAQMGGWGSCPN